MTDKYETIATIAAAGALALCGCSHLRLVDNRPVAPRDLATCLADHPDGHACIRDPETGEWLRPHEFWAKYQYRR